MKRLLILAAARFGRDIRNREPFAGLTLLDVGGIDRRTRRLIVEIPAALGFARR